MRTAFLPFFSEKGVTYGHMFNRLGSCINKSRDLVQSHEYITVVVHLDYPCCIEGVCRGGDPARQEGSVSLHQEDGEACDGLAPGLALTTSEFAVKWVDSSPECRCSQY